LKWWYNAEKLEKEKRREEKRREEKRREEKRREEKRREEREEKSPIILPASELDKLSKTTQSYPALIISTTQWLPMYPVPPVIR